jgi:hypothetical protein
VEILPELHQLSDCIRLFITSRDEDDIRESLRRYRKHELLISMGDTRDDIKRYVVGTLDNHMRANPSFVRNRSIIGDIIRTVVEQANGMYVEDHWYILSCERLAYNFPRFLLVCFQLKNILECDSDARIRKELGNLPKGLGETFVRVIRMHPGNVSCVFYDRLLNTVGQFKLSYVLSVALQA